MPSYVHKWLKLKLVTKDPRTADGNPHQISKLVNKSLLALNTSTPLDPLRNFQKNI